MSYFPHENPIDVGRLLRLDDELVLPAKEIIDLLADQLTEERRQRIDEVIADRTYTVVPVMDGIYDLGNAAAVLRTSEGLGFGAAHVIDTQPDHKLSRRVTQGADKWLDVERWRRPKQCVAALKERGYTIVATHLDADKTLEELDFCDPVAIVFGNEQDGVSDKVLEAADHRCIIPISGFVQSFNISVAAALSLYEAKRQRVERLGSQGDLTTEQRRILRAHYYLRSATRPRRLVPRLWRRQGDGSDRQT